jgi:hypothetical protein
VPADWPERFLGFYARHGVRWRAAKYAGIAYDTLVRAEAADPLFARQVENARQEFADSQELALEKMGRKGNPVGPIVLLKKHRPLEYIEKNLSISASFTTELPDADGKALLHAMLGQPAGATFEVLETDQPRPTHILDESGPGADVD